MAGINLYTYCSNNPINWIDPFGFDKTKQKSYWDYYWEALRNQFNDPLVISNQYLEEYWLKGVDWLWQQQLGLNALRQYGYVDIGINLGWGEFGFTGGFKIAPNGFYGYYGVGSGFGLGISATYNIGDMPSVGTSFTGTASGGSLVGGRYQVKFRQGNQSISVGGGLGLGYGATVTFTRTRKIF